ncbi:hypothetical protein PRIPAC_73680 [Pristionchus pacificus]|uniref:Major sperm protein n=1 Tax=Pristionchus pacificus TaxID=54126 RepID=A0A2A6C0W3_PRIPA|nr:hypothetical protein PRIPAC_73680 [Pristionchus pacificus]|eukprot:PDM71671.1 MSP domain-containing protein [Pristionchus pacificus]
MAVRKIPTKGNKPGEPPFKLELDTKDVLNMKWEKNMGSTFTDIKMTNQFDEFHTFKVKCTDNNIFRVRPPMGAIDPKTSVNIRVIQHAQERPPNNKHFVAILHMKCTAADAKKRDFKMQVWRPDSKPEGVIRIPIVFVDAVNPTGPSAPSAPAPADLQSTVAPTVKQ